MNRTDYEDKVNIQLTDTNIYTQIHRDDTKDIKINADTLILKLYEKNIISKKQKNYLTNFEPKCPTFYGIPKIHKENIPLRPIVSQINGPTSKINEIVDYFLSFAEKSIPDLLQDTTAYLNLLNKYQNEIDINENTYLITMDVVSLYTNIPHTEGAELVSEYYELTKTYWTNHSIPLISKELLKELILFILNNTTFTFHNNFYNQKYGTTMGAIFSVKYANIYMYMFFKKFLSNYTSPAPPFLARLVDDVFTIWNTNETIINKFITDLNNYHNTIKFEVKYSKTEIQFLDTITYKHNNYLHTKLYIKPTDNKQYLHFTSSHPKHIKKSIPYSQALRYKRIISDDKLLLTELNNLKEKFTNRQYPIDLVNSQIDKVLNVNREDTLIYKTTQEKQEAFNNFTGGDAFLPLIITFHPTLLQQNDNIHNILLNEWQEFVTKQDKITTTFQNNKPKIVFKKGKTIAQHLMSAKHPPRWHEHNDDDHLINNLAQLLQENENIDNFTYTIRQCKHPLCKCCAHISFPNHSKITLNSSMDCNSNNIIYLISCTKCKLNYIGQTKRKLKDRLNGHRTNIKHKRNTAIAIHFNNTNHKLTHLKISPIEQIYTNIEETRLKRENFWINTLNTKYPNGLNNYPIIY